jgi:acyl-coenzyme A synthetase/AMP-(fatty) acid ligase
MKKIEANLYIKKGLVISHEDIANIDIPDQLTCGYEDISLILAALNKAIGGNTDISLILKPDNFDFSLEQFLHNRGCVTIFSSGTTGEPKPISVPWEKILANVTNKISPGEIVVSGYDLTKFAGLQALLACIKNRAVYLDVGVEFEILENVEFSRILGTPSWCNYLMMYLARQKTPNFNSVNYITLGGEAADIKTLKNLKAFFPYSKIVQIYASTEAGVLFSVKDGLPGICLREAEKLSREERLSWSVKLEELRDGESTELLFFDEEKSCLRASGDIFRRADDRLIFFGRTNDCVSIGGQNISLFVLEEFVKRDKRVFSARATVKKNSIMGNIVVLAISLNEPVDNTELKSELLARIRTELGSRYLPGIVRFVKEIQLNSNGKINRK